MPVAHLNLNQSPNTNTNGGTPFSFGGKTPKPGMFSLCLPSSQIQLYSIVFHAKQ
jgi:hypothetical protein